MNLTQLRQPDVVKGFWAEGNAAWYFVHVNLVGSVTGGGQRSEGEGEGEGRNQPDWLTDGIRVRLILMWPHLFTAVMETQNPGELPYTVSLDMPKTWPGVLPGTGESPHL